MMEEASLASIFMGEVAHGRLWEANIVLRGDFIDESYMGKKKTTIGPHEYSEPMRSIGEAVEVYSECHPHL